MSENSEATEDPPEECPELAPYPLSEDTKDRVGTPTLLGTFLESKTHQGVPVAVGKIVMFCVMRWIVSRFCPVISEVARTTSAPSYCKERKMTGTGPAAGCSC